MSPKTLFEGVIRRHAATIASDGSGLSPLQQAMLRDPRPVRIYAAPTGAGKSYTFQKAVTDNGARVFFIVPTRRLAENLAESLREALAADPRYGESEVARRVMLWTSDERQRQQEADPTVRIGRLRLRQVRAYDEVPEKGVMIIATPESVAWALLSPSRQTPGTPALDVTDFLQFDHIVFDEFHSIEARGFGFASVVARFASMVEASRVTFLSATPIDIRSTLLACGVEPNKIASDAENVVTGTPEETAGLRAIHGDVRLEIIESETPLDALRARIETARACLARGRQVVVIYDSLAALTNERTAFADLLDVLGVPPDQRLLVNSAADSGQTFQGQRFASGRDQDPMKFQVLVATSSVEMGVTFRAGMIVMDPGHEPASFVQRIGRVARGDEPGDIVVALGRRRQERDAWLRKLLRKLADLGAAFPVTAFVDACLEAARKRFAPVAGEAGDQPTRVFRSMPARATWSAMLFWAALHEAAPHKGQRDNLRDFRSKKAGLVIRKLDQVGEEGPNGAAWRDAMLREARILRTIDGRVKLIDPDGRTEIWPWRIYASSPELASAPTRISADGETLEVLIDSSLENMPRLGGGRAVPSVEVLYPHTASQQLLPQRGVVDAWLKGAESAMRNPRLTSTQLIALEAAIELVRMTGIIPSRTSESGVGAGMV